MQILLISSILKDGYFKIRSISTLLVCGQATTLKARKYFLECSYKKIYYVIKDKLFIFPNPNTEFQNIF